MIMLFDKQNVTPYFVTMVMADGNTVCLGTKCSHQFGWVELNLDLLVELILFNAEILQTTY